jgi:TatD DNase family protein
MLPCLGLHPDRADQEPFPPVEAQIRASADRIAAIGEVGLDFWIAESDEARERQREVLRAMVALAAELDLPLSIHSRSAGHHTVALLEEAGARRVCLHAFDGAAKHAARAAELGYALSIPPSILRSPQKQKLVRRVGLGSLLLETDSPVLAPAKGERNVPANLLRSAEAIAHIQGIPLEEVLERTSENAWRLFRLERFESRR